MAIYKPGGSKELVRIYTTETIFDNSESKAVYKGFISLHARKEQDILAYLNMEAKELNANAIIGVKISKGAHFGDPKYLFTLIGTAVHVSQ